MSIFERPEFSSVGWGDPEGAKQWKLFSIFKTEQSIFVPWTFKILITIFSGPKEKHYRNNFKAFSQHQNKIIVFFLGHTFRFTGILRTKRETGMITRRRSVSYIISCTYIRRTGTTALASIDSVNIDIIGRIRKFGGSIDMYLKLLDKQGNIMEREDTLIAEVRCVL